MQTKPPFWLEKAYSAQAGDTADVNFNLIDTGAAQSNCKNLAAVSGSP